MKSHFNLKTNSERFFLLAIIVHLMVYHVTIKPLLYFIIYHVIFLVPSNLLIIKVN